MRATARPGRPRPASRDPHCRRLSRLKAPGSATAWSTLTTMPARVIGPHKLPSRPQLRRATTATQPHTSSCASPSRATPLITTHPTAPAAGSPRSTGVDHGGAPTRGPSTTRPSPRQRRPTRAHEASSSARSVSALYHFDGSGRAGANGARALRTVAGAASIERSSLLAIAELCVGATGAAHRRPPARGATLTQRTSTASQKRRSGPPFRRPGGHACEAAAIRGGEHGGEVRRGENGSGHTAQAS